MHNFKWYENPGYLSQLFFCWLIPIFNYGRKNVIELKDLHNVLPKDASEILGNKFERNWFKEMEDAQKSKRKPSFQRVIFKTYGSPLIMFGICTFFLLMVIKTLQPIALGLLIEHFSPNATSTTNHAIFYAGSICLMTFLNSIIFACINYRCRKLGMQLRVATSSLIYRKAMRLSSASATKARNGLMINLLSNDIVKFDNVFTFVHYLWITPLQALVIGYMIWRSVGIASLAGISCMMILTVPYQICCGKMLNDLRKKIAERMDKRALLMNEILNGISVIKMYTWEPVFERLVYIARRNELNVIAYANYIKGIASTTYLFAQRSSLFLTILVYTLQNNLATADKVFMISQFLSSMQFFMNFSYYGLSYYAEAKVSMNRIKDFLLLQEINNDTKSSKKNDENLSVVIEDVSASWENISIADTLNDINITIPDKSLYAIVGPVGAGKSSFLKLILDELRPRQGKVTVTARVSYASQEPWLFDGSVRYNILFGEPYSEDKYNRVTQVCCLLEDFEQLPYSDMTLVGDRGCALSGGQRARINLARAVYRDAEIYLLDDPLSAVDTRVGKKLFQGCINGYLKDKIRILVTHQVQFLKEVDAIVFLEKGKVKFQGNFENFRVFSKYFQHLKKSGTLEKMASENASTLKKDTEKNIDVSNLNKQKNQEKPKKNQEITAKGNVPASLYWKYLKSNGSYCLLLTYFICYVVTQVIISGSDYWLAFWIRNKKTQSFAMQEENYTYIIPSHMNLSDERKNTLHSFLRESELSDRNFTFYIYGMMILAYAVMSTGKDILLFKICKNANSNIHKMMVNCVLKAPMRFFNANPRGQILNRFLKDLNAVDEILPIAMHESFFALAIIFGTAVQLFLINWWLIFPTIVIFIAMMCLRRVYLKIAHDIKRLEGVAKSPVLSHANSSLSGLLTIRSCRAESMVCKEFDSFQDEHTSTFFLVLSAMSAFGLWIDCIIVVFVTIVTFSFIAYDNQTMSGDKVGLAITQVLGLTEMFQFGMKMAAEMEMQMIGVERLFQFTNIEQESPCETGHGPLEEWPYKGQIVFDHLYLRYTDEVEPVLKNLNCAIEPGTKIGIVGRTGAGKSSLISALFHLAEIKGKIYIDDVDTSTIGLRELRSKLSIISQEPMLFSTSIRDNLDPFSEFDDAQLWSALKDVKLNENFSSLDQFVDKDGLSVGQRQLLCLARAIVRNGRILILDEATANVDPATDALIQKTIRTNFKDCTVLTIAHRLNTIMDSDKVLVMNNGEAVEFDHPHFLLQKNNGYFIKMVEETDIAMANHLKNIANNVFYDSENQYNNKE